MEEEILLSGALVFRERGGKVKWVIVKPGKDDEWQLPKGVVRRGESSVRSVLRTVGELAGLRVTVIEEVGRMSTVTTRNGIPLARKIIYYLLMQQKGKNEVPSYTKIQWAEYAAAKTRLGTISEKRMLAQARALFTQWQKKEVATLR